MKQFEVGKSYYFTGLYTMGYWCTCVARTETTVTMSEVKYPDEPYTLHAIFRNKQTEYILNWEYKGEECYVYADMPDGYTRED